jgi:hypothetical protein
VLLVVIDCLGVGIVPYVALLVLPVLGRMRDQNDNIRLMATSCFASLVRLMSLDVSDPDIEIEDSGRMRGTAIAEGRARRRASRPCDTRFAKQLGHDVDRVIPFPTVYFTSKKMQPSQEAQVFKISALASMLGVQ